MSQQPSLFDAPPALPEGARYAAEFLTVGEERALAEAFAGYPFQAFELGPYRGLRRVVWFGWKYDYSDRRLHPAPPIPELLGPVRERAERFAGMKPGTLQQMLVTEYRAGAGIGWHRDRAEFGRVVGISLLSACTFRFRRRTAAGWERARLLAEPRSAYLLDGAARHEWEHSIAAVDALRYSITLRERL
jgi:alkylated DNA repair dioxygenase AlkB